jgi:hypothetical protein
MKVAEDSERQEGGTQRKTKLTLVSFSEESLSEIVLTAISCD